MSFERRDRYVNTIAQSSDGDVGRSSCHSQISERHFSYGFLYPRMRSRRMMTTESSSIGKFSLEPLPPPSSLSSRNMRKYAVEKIRVLDHRLMLRYTSDACIK